MTTVRRRPTPPGIEGGAGLLDPDEIARLLRDAGHTVGTTRTEIVDVVLAHRDAFTAEQLTAELDRAHVDVHASTVYRTLGLLEEVGVVQHVHVSHGPALYEVVAHAGDRRHLVCDRCGDHLTVPSEVFASAARRLERDHGFILEGSHFAVVGRCRACASEP